MDDYINKIADCRYCGAQYTVEEFESFVKFEDLPKKNKEKYISSTEIVGFVLNVMFVWLRL